MGKVIRHAQGVAAVFAVLAQPHAQLALWCAPAASQRAVAVTPRLVLRWRGVRQGSRSMAIATLHASTGGERANDLGHVSTVTVRRIHFPVQSGSRKSQKWHMVRVQRRAARHAVQCMLLLTKLRVLPTSPMMLPDIRRMRILAEGLVSRGCHRCSVVCALLVDWAARSPRFSQELLMTLPPGLCTSLDGLGMAQHALSLHGRGAWKSFWSGRSRSHMRAALAKWSAAEIALAGSALAGAGTRVRSERGIAWLQAMPHMGSYLSVSALRAVSLAMRMQLRGWQDRAAGMSLHTSLLHNVISFDEARVAFRKVSATDRQKLDDGWLAYVYCETCKVMRHADAIKPMQHYAHKQDAFASALAAPQMRTLLKQLDRAGRVDELEDAEALSTTECMGELQPHVSFTSGGSVRRFKRGAANSITRR